jgi:hypothetical protein
MSLEWIDLISLGGLIVFGNLIAIVVLTLMLWMQD